ncbi:MAG: hypothetical protein R6V40_00985 [Candidatus Moraniibacteriota bacterium]
MKRKFVSIEKAKRIYFKIFLACLMLLLTILFLAGIELEKQRFYSKANFHFSEVERAFAEIEKNQTAEDSLDLEQKKKLLKQARNLESKLFNLKALYFHQEGDFSLKYFNLEDREYLKKLEKTRRVFLSGQGYIRTLEMLIFQKEASENQRKIHEKSRNLLQTALRNF